MQSITQREIRKTVSEWTTSQRLELIQELIQDLKIETSPSNAPKKTADYAFGLVAKHMNQPPPTDEEVKQWLEDRRLQKYGS